jgi:hypothetical protein
MPYDEMFDFDCTGHMTLSSSPKLEIFGGDSNTNPVSAICPDGTIVPATRINGCEYVWITQFVARTTGRIMVTSAGNSPSIVVNQIPPKNPQLVYWNDTVDLSQLEGTTGIITRFPGGQCVDVSSNSHKIFIDPSIFPAGVWYQWSSDGDYASGNQYSGGNLPVFEVVAGTRPQ